MTTSKPDKTIDNRAFRNVMGRFATGVTVIATEIDGEIQGMTANAITSVSLDPLLVLVCVQKEAHMTAYLRQSGEFSINILNEDQENLSNYFAGIWPDDKPPPSFVLEAWVCGPRLQGILGALACEIKEFLEGGDHWIIIGAVIDLYLPEEPPSPLLFYRGRYRKVLGE